VYFIVYFGNFHCVFLENPTKKIFFLQIEFIFTYDTSLDTLDQQQLWSTTGIYVLLYIFRQRERDHFTSDTIQWAYPDWLMLQLLG